MRIEEFWDKWVLFDDNGVVGISEDAPEEAKKAFEEYMNQQNELYEDGIKV